MHRILFNKTLLYGPGSLMHAGEAARPLGRKALIVTGKASVKKSGTLSLLQDTLEKNNISHVLFEGVVPNPTVRTVDECVLLGKKEKCDFLIGLGGGSSLDTAKAAAALLANPGSVQDYLETGSSRRTLSHSPLPVMAVPTTAGTGSEATQNAVIVIPEQGLKVSIRDERLVPAAAVLDPHLLSSAPREIMAAAAMDALTQLIEPYTGKNPQPFLDPLIRDGIKKINKNILAFINDPSDIRAGMELLLAAYISGLALANAGLGAVHALSRPFSGLYGLPHGLVCAVLLPYITEMNIGYGRERYAEAARCLGAGEKNSCGKTADLLPERLYELNRALGIPPDFKKFGIPKKDTARIIDQSRGSSLKNNPRDFSDKELEELLLKLI